MKLRIAVCDDEEEILKKESCMIKEILDKRNIEYELDEYISPEKLLSSQNLYDMLFLDIEMNSFNGIDVGAKLMQRKSDSYIFFITNYPIYMDKALDIRPHRYLSKPVDYDRLSSGIESALKKIGESTKIITVTCNKQAYNIPIASIIFIENTGRHTKIYLTSRPAFVADEIFSKVKDKIEREVDLFATPQQSYYVNMRFVDDYDKNDVILSYAGKTYRVDMSCRGYKGFNDKMFAQAKLLR